MGRTFEDNFPEWLGNGNVVEQQHHTSTRGDDATRDGPASPSFDDRWHAQNEAFTEDLDSDGWPQVDVADHWNTDSSFKAPIVSIAKVSSSASASTSEDDDETSKQRDDAFNTPRKMIVMRVKQQQKEGRDDVEEPRGSNGDFLTSNGKVLTLANAAAASIYASPALSITDPPSSSTAKESPKQLYKKLPLLLCKSGRRRPKATGAFPTLGASQEQFRPIVKPPAPSPGDKGLSKPGRPNPSPRINRLCFDDFDAPERERRVTFDDSQSLPNPRRRLHYEETLPIPKNSLDFFCRDSGLVVTAETMHQQNLLSTKQSEEDTVSSSSYEEDDQDDDLTVSSLPNGVADCKVARSFFLSDIPEEELEEEESEKRKIEGTNRSFSGHEEKIEKLDIERTSGFDRNQGPIAHCEENEEAQARTQQALPISSEVQNSVDRVSPTKPRHSHLRPASGRKVAARQQWLRDVFQRKETDKKESSGSISKPVKTETVSTTPVTGAIARFGGRAPRKSKVQKRREEFERKAAAIRIEKGSPSLKTTWEASEGGYRKKVVLA